MKPAVYPREPLGLRSRFYGRWLMGLLLVGLFWLAVDSRDSRAGHSCEDVSSPMQTRAQPRAGSMLDPDDNCLMCHADPDFKGSFEDGELSSLYVDSGEYEQSVHGPAGLNCVACHTDVSRYPHHIEEQITCIECHGEDGGTADTSHTTLRVKLPYADHREMTLAINESCRSCHEQEYEVAGPSAHVRVFEGGNFESATCVDCHGSHGISRPEVPRSKISEICGECHKAVYSTYRSSVHGAALEVESNPDVPSCVDCHGVHSVRGPRDPTYRNDSVSICSSCHGAKAVMEQYGVATGVVQTYLDDFHGRTVDLFRRFDPGTPSDKAVCFDCHGIHNIRHADDPLASIHPDKLQQTCQQCHKDASANFTASWLSHQVPALEDNLPVSIVNTVYTILIPLTIGGMLGYVSLDMGRRWWDKRKAIRRAKALAEKELQEYDFTNDGR
jgi:predicted CXXCH cytochrome family protein